MLDVESTSTPICFNSCDNSSGALSLEELRNPLSDPEKVVSKLPTQISANLV